MAYENSVADGSSDGRRPGRSRPVLRVGLLLMVLSLLGLGAWMLIPDTEPAYEGRSLSSWLEDFDTHAGDTNALVYHAIQAMGTNAIPRLVDDVLDRDPGWRTELRRRFRTSRQSWLGESPALAVRSRAAQALRALGQNAAPALPPLIDEVRKSGGRSGLPWVGLSAIARNVPDAIPTLIRELDEPAYRMPVARLLGMHPIHSEESIPFLIQCVQDKNAMTRYYGVVALGRFGAEAADAEAMMRNLLEDSNPQVRSAAADALQRIGSSALTVTESESPPSQPAVRDPN